MVNDDIITSTGNRHIGKIANGAQVLCSDNTFHKVLSVISRRLNDLEKLYVIKFDEHWLYVTGGQKILIDDNKWVRINKLGIVSSVAYINDNTICYRTVRIEDANRSAMYVFQRKKWLYNLVVDGAESYCTYGAIMHSGEVFDE